jgi:hypothetical protein
MLKEVVMALSGYDPSIFQNLGKTTKPPVKTAGVLPKRAIPLDQPPDIIFFTWNDFRNNLLKSWHKVVKHHVVIIMGFIICFHHQILLGRSNQGWDTQDMYMHGGEREMHIQFRKPKGNRPLGRPKTIISRS